MAGIKRVDFSNIDAIDGFIGSETYKEIILSNKVLANFHDKIFHNDLIRYNFTLN